MFSVRNSVDLGAIVSYAQNSPGSGRGGAGQRICCSIIWSTSTEPPNSATANHAYAHTGPQQVSHP
jgi:hypothetical protein